MIQTIIFDLGKVIIPFDFQRGYDRLAPLCNYSAQEIPDRFRTGDFVERLETGQLEPEDFVRQASAALGVDISYTDFCDIWSSIFLPDTLIPESLLVALKQNYRLLLLSNTNAIHFEMVDKAYPLLRHFDHKVLSYKIGAMKPSPKIYQEAIANANCKAEECFFTDDIAAYVEGAREQGIDAVQFQNRAQLEQELRQRGVIWSNPETLS